MADSPLNAEEWEAAMKLVQAADDPAPKEESAPGKKPVLVKRVPKGSKVKVVPTKDALVVEIPSGGGWASRTGRPEAKGPVMKEIPDNHPAGTSHPITPADPQENDTDDKPGIVDEIPAGGGFQPKTGKPESKNTDLNEIPDNHPPAAAKPRTPADWASLAKMAADALNYGTDTTGWSTGKSLPKAGEPWGQNFPQGAHQDLPSDGKTVTSTVNKAPRTSLAKLVDSGKDGERVMGPDDSIRHDHASLPDGSFTIHTSDDVQNAVAKVQNADQNNPHQATPGKAWFSDIKRHIVKRADSLGANHLIPADWQLSLG